MAARYSAGPYAAAAGWWTWKSITRAPGVRRRRRARSAPPARGSRSPRRGRAPAACPRARRSTKRSSWSAKQTSVLSPGGSSVSVVPSASSTVRRNVGGSSVARPLGPGDDELAPRQHRRQPDDLEARDGAVGVGEDAAVDVRSRVGGIGAQAPARDVDRRLAEQVVDPVAGVDAVGDDRRESLERAQPARVGDGILLGVGGLVADRRLDQQRPSRARRSRSARAAGRPRGGAGRSGRSGAAPRRPGASRTSAVSATESPSGFSASTHLPASSAVAHEAGGGGGRRRDRRRRRRRDRVSTDTTSVVRRTPSGAAARRSSSRSATATSAARGSRASAGR